MVSKKKIILIILLLIIVAVGAYFIYNYTQAKESIGTGEHNILILCTDPSENRPGTGAVDMAFVIHVNDGNVGNITPVYPGGLAHPTLEPTADMRAEGVNKYYLHDSLWSSDLEEGTKIAQEIVEYHTGMTTDMVIIITPTAVDALIDAVKPVYSDGQEVANISSIDFLREDQSNNGATRGDAVEGLAEGIKEAAERSGNKEKLIKVGMEQYTQGNIKAVPSDKFIQFVTYEGMSSVFG